MNRPFQRVLASLLLPATLSFAQAPSTTPLPSVVVTAPEPAPPSAGTVSSLALTAPALNFVPELQNLTNRVPNFSISDASQHSLGAIYSMRGVANTVFFSSQAVAFYQDDVPLGDAFTFAAPLYDVDHVEVYRGPQPDRFGLNSEAGLIRLFHRQADPQKWHGEATASYGSYDTQEYRLSLGGPLIKDKLTLELAGYWGLSSGYVTNDFLGVHRDRRDTLSGRAVLTWTPQPDWRITAGIEGTRINDGSQRLVPLTDARRRVTSDVEGGLDTHQRREWLDITKRFDNFEVRSITGHMGWQANPAVLDLDLSPARADVAGIFPGVLPIAPGGTSTIRRSQGVWSQELRVSSLSPEPPAATETDKDGKAVAAGKDTKAWKPETTLNDPFRWQAGLFYQRKDTQGDDLRAFSAPFVTGIPFGPVVVPITVYTPLRQTTQYHIVEEEYAGYANATYRLGKFELNGGARVDFDQKSFFRDKSDGLGGTLQDDGFHEDWSVAGSLGATYHATENVSVFARSAYGFKPGGFSAFTDNPKLAEYSRETDWSNELGVQAKAFDGRVDARLVGYYNHITNYQVERTFAFTDYLVLNAHRAESLGVEFELSVELMRGLTLSGNIGYNQTQLIGLRDPVTGADLSGNEAPYIPEFTALAALDYRHDCGVRAHVEVVGVGETQYTDLNTARYRQAPYALLNASVGYEYGYAGVYLFGRNLTDTKYFTQKTSDLDAGVIGEPTVVGVMAQLKF